MTSSGLSPALTCRNEGALCVCAPLVCLLTGKRRNERRDKGTKGRREEGKVGIRREKEKRGEEEKRERKEIKRGSVEE